MLMIKLTNTVNSTPTVHHLAIIVNYVRPF